jgi:hypothetical protein
MFIILISSVFLFLRNYPNDRFLAVIFILSGIIQIFENFGCFRINRLFINPIFYLLIFMKIFSLSGFFIRRWWFNPVILYILFCFLYVIIIQLNYLHS